MSLSFRKLNLFVPKNPQELVEKDLATSFYIRAATAMGAQVKAVKGRF